MSDSVQVGQILRCIKEDRSLELGRLYIVIRHNGRDYEPIVRIKPLVGDGGETSIWGDVLSKSRANTGPNLEVMTQPL